MDRITSDEWEEKDIEGEDYERSNGVVRLRTTDLRYSDMRRSS